MLELAKIKINDTMELPMRCDLYVLNMIQQKFGNIEDFEKKLVGIKEVNGMVYRCEPSVEAVATALPLMVMEGIEIENELNGKNYDIKTARHLIALTTRNYRELAEELHEEMKRCFQTKKGDPSRSRAKKVRK